MPPLSEAGSRKDGRLTFQEAMRMMSLPDQQGPGGTIKRYMSERAAWSVGSDLDFVTFKAAYGGRKFSQERRNPPPPFCLPTISHCTIPIQDHGGEISIFMLSA